jgi:hypothetical protein
MFIKKSKTKNEAVLFSVKGKKMHVKNAGIA